MAAEEQLAGGRVWRFGPFEMDESTGELRRNGVSIHLQEQPCRVLVLLLRNAGRLVTREQLRRQLWAEDTFVGFDQGLNTAVRKLREALADDAERPLYVETIPRKGYRFIATAVASAAPSAAAPAADAPSRADPGVAVQHDFSAGPGPQAESDSVARAVAVVAEAAVAWERSRRRWRTAGLLSLVLGALAILALVLGLLLIAALLQRHPRPVSSTHGVRPHATVR